MGTFSVLNIASMAIPTPIQDSRIICLFQTTSNHQCDLPDLISIPDFISGAMENWGIVTFRETAILISNASTTADHQWVANVVTHELAHMVRFCSL